MDANKIWNKIVSEYELYKNYKEEEVQTLWEGYFSNLFEYDRQADFLVQVPIHIGSTDKKADIILKTNNTCLCVIELKQYSYAKEIDYEYLKSGKWIALSLDQFIDTFIENINEDIKEGLSHFIEKCEKKIKDLKREYRSMSSEDNRYHEEQRRKSSHSKD